MRNPVTDQEFDWPAALLRPRANARPQATVMFLAAAYAGGAAEAATYISGLPGREPFDIARAHGYGPGSSPYWVARGANVEARYFAQAAMRASESVTMTGAF